MSLRNYDQGQGDKHRAGGETSGSWALFTLDSNDLASWKSVGKSVGSAWRARSSKDSKLARGQTEKSV